MRASFSPLPLYRAEIRPDEVMLTYLLEQRAGPDILSDYHDYDLVNKSREVQEKLKMTE